MNSRIIQTPDGISWYTETIQSAARSASTEPNAVADAEHIVLVPSGEGDCHNLAGVAKHLVAISQRQTVVTTFDMPGYSRSTAPKEAYAVITPQLVAKQIIGLLDQLQISQATFFGCSSGGGAVLAIAALYPERVKCSIVHEVPFASPEIFLATRQGSDEEIAKFCHHIFYEWIEEQNDGKRKYKALGDEYFRRLDKNFVVWMRCLVSHWEEPSRALVTRENLRKRPLFWTVGQLSQREFWQSNFDIAEEHGLKVETDVLKCIHFPAVTVPEETAEWIRACVDKAESST